jgi:hypothetical protein
MWQKWIDEISVKCLVGKPEDKRPRGRPGRIWKDNIRMDIRELRWEVVNWIHLRIGTSGGLL